MSLNLYACWEVNIPNSYPTITDYVKEHKIKLNKFAR